MSRHEALNPASVHAADNAGGDAHSAADSAVRVVDEGPLDGADHQLASAPLADPGGASVLDLDAAAPPGARTAADIGAEIGAEGDGRSRFRVATFGLAPRFHRLLEIICRHARHNPYQFIIGEPMNEAAFGLSEIAFEIAVVDVTTHEGTETARLLKLLPSGQPVIEVGRRLHHARGSDDVQLRNFSLEVLSVLNHTAESLTRRGERRVRLLRPEPIFATGEGRPRRPPRVLVLDPSPSIRSQVAVAIRRIGADAEEVGTLAAALDILAARRYELVITELDLPDGDGFSLMRSLRQSVTGRRPRVVVLSERDGWVDQARAALAGCSGFLGKPVSFAALHATTRRMLGRHRTTTRYLARDVAGAFTVRDGWLARWSSRGANGTLLPPASAGAMRRGEPLG